MILGFVAIHSCGLEPSGIMALRKLPDSGTAKQETEDPSALGDNCDLPALKLVVEDKCATCHGGDTTVGDYSIEGEWKKNSLAPRLAVEVIKEGVMPPPGVPGLTEEQHAVVNECISKDPLTVGLRTPTSSVETVCPSEIEDTPGWARTRLLSKIELSNTLKAIVGSSNMGNLSASLDLLPSGDASQTFSSQTNNATETQVDALVNLAEDVSDVFIASQPLRQFHVPCLATLPASVTTGCRDSSLQSLALTFYRRPATAGDLADLLAVWQGGASTSTSLALVIRYLTQSPYFLYLSYDGVPSGDDPNVFTLTAYELAQRLSYWILKAPPDATLLAKAANGTLTEDAVLATEVVRLMNDSRAHEATRLFASEWLGLDYMSPFPTESTFLNGITVNGLASEMRDEILSFVEGVIHGGGSYEELMLSTRAKVTPRLAEIYGVTGVSGTTLVELDDATRAGLLTRAALHVRSIPASPYHMAKTVYEKVIACEKLAPPPAGATTAVEGIEDVPMTYRQKFESVTLEPACIGCHNMLNAPAFAFQYDAIGRFFETETTHDRSGNPGAIVATDRSVNAYIGRITEAQRVNGPVEMSQYISESEMAQRCFLTQAVRFGEGRSERIEEGCSIERARRRGGISLRDQIAAYVTSKGFRQFRLTE